MKPLVWLTQDGYWNMQAGNNVYDFEITISMTVDFWLRQLSDKTWLTDKHLDQFYEMLTAKNIWYSTEPYRQSRGDI